MANARIRSLTYAGVAAVLAAIVAGCGGNSVTVAACSTPAGMQASLIYPAPGSTGIPDNVSQVIIATNSTLPSDWQVGFGWNVLLAYAYSGAYGSGHYGAEFVAASPSPLPSPAATPGFAGPYQYWSSTIPYGGVSAIPNLPPATAITVELNDSNSNCYPGVAIGGFTSQ